MRWPIFCADGALRFGLPIQCSLTRARMWHMVCMPLYRNSWGSIATVVWIVSMETLSAHILVVDDQRGHRDVIKLFLQKAGFRVTVAKDPRIAMVLARKKHFDLVITDYDMPFATGTKFITDLRKIRGYRDTPVFLLTAKAAELDRDSLEQDLSLLLVPKPCSLTSLVEKVSMCLSILSESATLGEPIT